MNAIEAAGVIPYRYNHHVIEFLLVKHLHGHWEFPKGKLDNGETEKHAAVRELAEEAGVAACLHDEFYEVITYTFFDQYTNKNLKKTVHFFIGEVVDGKVKISHEHADFIWLAYDQAYKYLTHSESIVLLEKAHIFLKYTTEHSAKKKSL